MQSLIMKTEKKIMNRNPILVPTSCAICGVSEKSTEIYPANFSIQDFNPEVFSARRLPDKIHYRVVRCRACGLVRSDPIIDNDTLAELYTKSNLTYDDEVPNLMESYIRYLVRAIRYLDDKMESTLSSKRSILEIGCGSGFFLEKALDYGFEQVMGIEPSLQAVEKSSSRIRQNIICDIIRPGLLQPEQFDIICMFQVFDHIADPGSLLGECQKALKPGGVILCLNHDVSAFSARLLGASSPIIDIEHTFLYSKATIRRIFSDNGFIVRQVGSATNTCSLCHLFHLLPLPNDLKKSILSTLRRHSVGKIKLSVRLGNLFLIAQKNVIGGITDAD
jgi:SAM-dependent methyltransferase